MTIGAIGLTILAFFYIIGLPLFVIGLILVLASKQTRKQKLKPISIIVLYIIVFWLDWKMFNSVGPEIFLIPSDYRGKVNVIFKEGCGIRPEKSSNGTIYRIPEDGILILDAKQEYGFIEHSYLFEDEQGKRTEIPKMDVRNFNEEWTVELNPNEPSREKLGVFHWGRTGSIGKKIDANGNVTNQNELYSFTEFYISNYRDLSQKYNFKYDLKFDSLKKSKLEICN